MREIISKRIEYLKEVNGTQKQFYLKDVICELFNLEYQEGIGLVDVASNGPVLGDNLNHDNTYEGWDEFEREYISQLAEDENFFYMLSYESQEKDYIKWLENYKLLKGQWNTKICTNCKKDNDCKERILKPECSSYKLWCGYLCDKCWNKLLSSYKQKKEKSKNE